MRRWLTLLVLFAMFGEVEASDCTPSPPPLRYATAHFSIAYAVSGEEAVLPGDGGATASLLDGTVLATVPGGDGIPDYVQLVGVYLEHAWDVYAQADFRLPPAPTPVLLLNDLGAYGMYLPKCGEIYLEADLVSPGTTAAHELFHAIQYRYWTTEDFAAIPGKEQAFYKEATADWAMIQVMQPTPYISWFNDPDRVSLFEAGTSAAFFWIYYTEQLSAWRLGDPLSPGFDAMRAYLERVASTELDLQEALEEGPAAAGDSLDALLERFTLANLLQAPLEGMSARSIRNLQTYVYKYGVARGFSNAVQPVLVDNISDAVQNGVQIQWKGAIDHGHGAAYFEIDPGIFAGYGKARLVVNSGEVRGYLVQLGLSPTLRTMVRLSVRRAQVGAPASETLYPRLNQRLWLVLYAPAGAGEYQVTLTLSPQ